MDSSEREQEPHAKRTGHGRVGRRRRLSADEIVTEAIELADEQGLEALSMPKLATRLGVGTMTLYGYVQSKEDLLDRIAQRIFQGLCVPDRDDWRQGLSQFFTDFRAAAIAHPSLAQLLATGRVTIPAVFEILETAFQQMVDDGIRIEDAVRTFYAGLTYTIGYVLWEVPRTQMQTEEEYARQWAALISQLDAERFPVVTGPAGEVAPTVASAQQFDWGLRRILIG